MYDFKANCKFQNESRTNSEFIQHCAGTRPSLPEGFPEGITLVRHRKSREILSNPKRFRPYRLHARRGHDARRSRIRFSASRFRESISVDGSRFLSPNVGTCLFHLSKTILEPSLFLFVFPVASRVASNSGGLYRIGSTYTTISTVCKPVRDL